MPLCSQIKLRHVCSVAFIVVMTAASFLPASATAQIDHYNMVFIMLDDLGKEWVSCFGAEDIETPNIDALANSGTKFNNFYCMPQCTPTRLTLLTGQYPYRHGWVNHWDVPRWGGGCSFDPKRNPSFPTAIRDAGYATVAAGKWQIDDFRVEPNAMKDAGFDKYCMWTGYESGNKPSSKRYQDAYVFEDGKSKTRKGKFGPDVFTDYLVDFIGDNKARPMFIYYPMALPHGPLVPTPDAPNAKGKLERHKAMVRYADKLVGRIVSAISENGLRKNTIIVFTTDNGSGGITGTLNGRKVQGGKAKTTENGVCVPFIVSCPGRIAEGAESSALIDITDIAPTFCELAKVEQANKSFDGKSFRMVLDGKSKESNRKWIMAMGGGNFAKLTDAGVENQYWFRDRVLRNERYKAFIGADRKLVKLVDVQNDFKETNDVQFAESVEIQNAKKMFMDAVAKMPKRDADPIYTPLEHRDWYKKPSTKTEVWKKGYPEKRESAPEKLP